MNQQQGNNEPTPPLPPPPPPTTVTVAPWKDPSGYESITGSGAPDSHEHRRNP